MQGKSMKLLAAWGMLAFCLATLFGATPVQAQAVAGPSPEILQGEESTLTIKLPFEITAPRQEVPQQGQNAQFLKEWTWTQNAKSIIISVDLADLEDGAFRRKLGEAGSEEALLKELQAGMMEVLKGRWAQQGIQLGQLQQRSYKIGTSPAICLRGDYQIQGRTQRADILFVLHGTNFWSIFFDSQQGDATTGQAIDQALASVTLDGTGFADGGQTVGKDKPATGTQPQAGSSDTVAGDDLERMKVGGGIVLLGLAVAAYGFFKKN